MSFSSATRVFRPFVISFPALAALRTQQVLAISAVPYQQIQNLTVDAQGNLIFSANVFASAQSYSFVEKTDSSGHAIFTLNVAQMATIALAVDSAGDVYLVSPCIPAVPYKSVTPTSSLAGDTSGDCLVKLDGQESSVIYQILMPQVNAQTIVMLLACDLSASIST